MSPESRSAACFCSLAPENGLIHKSDSTARERGVTGAHVAPRRRSFSQDGFRAVWGAADGMRVAERHRLRCIVLTVLASPPPVRQTANSRMCGPLGLSFSPSRQRVALLRVTGQRALDRAPAETTSLIKNTPVEGLDRSMSISNMDPMADRESAVVRRTHHHRHHHRHLRHLRHLRRIHHHHRRRIRHRRCCRSQHR